MKPLNTKQLFEALADVIDKSNRGVISKDNATSIIEGAKGMTSLLNYELKNARLRKDLGEKDVKINKITND